MAFLQILYLFFLMNGFNCFSCKNENDEAVDWYVLYKLPNEHNSNNLIKTGVGYMYITSNDDKIEWKLSNISINNAKSMPGLTLQPYYNKETSMHILYNDETPSGSQNERLGHTKGVLLSNESSGFWLVHSIPKYPAENIYSYPETGKRYGQSYLCISFNLDNINKIGRQLKYNEPQIYDSFLDKNLRNKLSDIDDVINKRFIKTAPWFQLIRLVSLKGVSFISFAKSRKFGKELYEDWVANALKSNLYVESWLNGSGRIPSNCSMIFQVKNIKEIEVFNSTFSSSKDHSKWAITQNIKTKSNWICVGDINREEKQKFRGGGTICNSNSELWNEYNRIIAETENCENEI